MKSGALYVGVSAGSIIAGPSIEIAGWGTSGDPNDVGLKDLAGLGFTNIAVAAHFEPRFQVEIDEFKKKVDYPVMEISNNQALAIDKNGHRIINFQA